MNPKKLFLSASVLPFLLLRLFAQTEVLTNSEIIDMVKSGLGNEVILKKIDSAASAFDVSVKALIEMKKSGVSDEVIGAVIEKGKTTAGVILPPDTDDPKSYSESLTVSEAAKSPVPMSAKESLVSAKTIALAKSSLQPSRQALEKELIKRKDWQQLNLTILRYKDAADLYVEIGYVSGSWITHRYVYRVYDRRSGAVIAAGETTSWGSLAENLARHIAKSLTSVRDGKT